jgi:ATP-dependent Lon protease
MQVMSPMQGGETPDLGVAQFVAMYSAVSDRRIHGGLVVLGSMTIHGILNRVDKLGERLRVALDSGAKQVLIPVVNAADLAAIPAELLDKLRLEFYSDPSQAAFKSVVGA